MSPRQTLSGNSSLMLRQSARSCKHMRPMLAPLPPRSRVSARRWLLNTQPSFQPSALPRPMFVALSPSCRCSTDAATCCWASLMFTSCQKSILTYRHSFTRKPVLASRRQNLRHRWKLWQQTILARAHLLRLCKPSTQQPTRPLTRNCSSWWTCRARRVGACS